MTAEEKLKDWYEQEPQICEFKDGTKLPLKKGELITPEHIDLIANLIVERMMKLFGREVKE